VISVALLLLALGGGACKSDGDCLLLRYPPEDCCMCGPGSPLAVSKSDAQKRGRPCGHCECPNDALPEEKPAETPQVAACRKNVCVLVPAPAPKKK
jgi:hypothetical protein